MSPPTNPAGHKNGKHAPKDQVRVPRGQPDEDAPADAIPPEPTGPEALNRLIKQAAELGEYVLYYLSLKADGARQSLRALLIRAVLSVLALVAVVMIIATGISRLVAGLAGALAALFPDSEWMGNFIVGCLLLGSLATLVYFGLARYQSAWHNRMEMKYEKRQDQQQTKYGRNISDQVAHAQPAKESQRTPG